MTERRQVCIDGTEVIVVTCHFGPPIEVLFNRSWHWLGQLIDVYPRQLRELEALVAQSQTEMRPDSALLVCGDFNAVMGSAYFRQLSATLQALDLAHITRFLEGSNAVTCNMPGERLLTRGRREPKVVDYIFGHTSSLASCACEARIDPQAAHGHIFEFISDHAALSAQVPL